MNNKRTFVKNSSIFGCRDMKKSPSEMALHELFPSEDEKRTQKTETFVGSDDVFFAVEDDGFFLPFKNPETPLSSCSSFADNRVFPGSIHPKQPYISTRMDSQSSICGTHTFTRFQQFQESINSPSSGTEPIGRHNQLAGASSGSDIDDLDIEAGSSEQSLDHLDIKRLRRMVSNRESAQRSRRRKQAHLAELKQEVENLNKEHDTLAKQLAGAAQRVEDAATNNRVLKSDVEALRAKVKLAEDMVARGSLNSSLSHLLQNYLNTTPTFMNSNIGWVDNISPTTFLGDDNHNTPYAGLTDSAIGHENAEAFKRENAEAFNGSVNTGVMSDTVSCVTEMWPWESHVPPSQSKSDVLPHRVFSLLVGLGESRRCYWFCFSLQ